MSLDNPSSPVVHPYELLGHSLKSEYDYYPEVEGSLPKEIQGNLYRNGPGLFDRDGYFKQHLLDGDGMIQKFHFHNNQVHYQNRFVKTEKFHKENTKEKFLFPTWTTLAPNWFNNLPGFPSKSQAGVTTLVKNKRLLAFDEVNPPYELDLNSLETLEEFFPDVGDVNYRYSLKAHTKTDGITGDWILVGVEPKFFHILINDKYGKLKTHKIVKTPRLTYLHDFFATPNYVIFLLHPIKISLFNFFSILTGFKSLTDGLEWKPELGNLIMVVPKDGKDSLKTFEASSSFMWHSLNAFEREEEIFADFVGYDNPDHFIGLKPQLKSIMTGEIGTANYSGNFRRYRINVNSNTLHEEILDSENFEFPSINPRRSCYQHPFGYFTTSKVSTIFHNGLAKIDLNTGKKDTFYFDNKTHVGEPIFVPKSIKKIQREEQNDTGWIFTLALDGLTQKSFLAVFDGDNLSSGPIAKILLTHHTPLSFHGWWEPTF